MSARSPGGTAFPCMFSNGSDQNVTAPDGTVLPPGGIVDLPGMTLRDYFAIQCMPISKQTFPDGMAGGWEALASHAYSLADAMLKARQS